MVTWPAWPTRVNNVFSLRVCADDIGGLIDSDTALL